MRNITNYDTESINRLSGVMSDVAYFPVLDLPHYEKFKNAYLNTAAKYNMLVHAEKVITKYEKYPY